MDCVQSTLYVRTYSVIKRMGNIMINFDDIHFIEDGDVYLLLHVPSFTLVSLSSDTANILKSLKEGASISDVAQNSSISLDEITRQRCGHHDQQQVYCSCSCISSKLIILFPIFLITEYVLTSDVFTVRSPSASYQ